MTTLPPAITTQPSAQGRRQAEAHHQSCMNVLAEARGGTPDHNALVLSHPLQGATGHSSDQQQSVLLLLDLLQDQGSQRYLEGNSSRQGSRTLTKLPPAITTSASNGEVQTAANNQVLLDMLIQSIGGTSGHNSHQLISLLQSLAGSPVSQIHSPQDLVNILHRQDHANMEILISSLIHLAGRNRRGSSSVEKVMQIVEALGGLAGPAGSAAVSLASLISAAVNSERTRRSGRFCYDYCHKCCEKIVVVLDVDVARESMVVEL